MPRILRHLPQASDGTSYQSSRRTGRRGSEMLGYRRVPLYCWSSPDRIASFSAAWHADHASSSNLAVGIRARDVLLHELSYLRCRFRPSIFPIRPNSLSNNASEFRICDFIQNIGRGWGTHESVCLFFRSTVIESEKRRKPKNRDT
jgi:hypothetical protein